MLLEQNIEFVEKLSKLTNVIKRIENNQVEVYKAMRSINEHTKEVASDQEYISNQVYSISGSTSAMQADLESLKHASGAQLSEMNVKIERAHDQLSSIVQHKTW